MGQNQQNPQLSDFLESKPCLICGGNDAEIVYEYPANYYDHERWDTASWDGRQSIPLSIVCCPKCGLMYSRPSFREDALNYVYPQDMVEPIEFDAALAESRGKHSEMLLELQSLRREGSLCDIGTRYGVLPHLAQEAGFDAFGIEYNAASVTIAAASGVPIYQGTDRNLPEILAKRGQEHVDVLVLDDIIEHLVDPNSSLVRLSDCQRPGGLMMLQTMDINSLGHRLYRRHWYHLAPAAHMFYFSEHTLRLLLDRAGYDIRRVVRPNPVRNLRRTLTRSLPGAALRYGRVVARGKGAKPKPSYINCRLRSSCDTILVVAEKR